MTDLYQIPSIPESLRPNRTESELSFIAPVERKNYVVNPSFEVDDVGETRPYGWSVGEYSYFTNQILAENSIGSVVSENVYSGFRAMRINLTDTDTSLVYGVTSPINVPHSMKRLVGKESGNVFYTIRGALSFYAFAPAISPLSPFSTFNQPAGTEHVIDVDVFANVDFNGNPTGQFNEQDIITSSKIAITVPESSFFSEDIEPNVIGRRKNPEWERHYVYFSVRYVPGTNTFLRFAIKNNTETFDGISFLFYLDAVQVEFFDDDLQYPTSYFDGNTGIDDPIASSGYYWTGSPLKSESVRSIDAESGGVLFNFQSDFGFQIVTINGLGLPTPENQINPFEFVDGQQYNGTGIKERVITVVGSITNGTFLQAFRNAGQLQFFLSKQRSGVSRPVRFYFRIPTSCKTKSQFVYFNAVVQSVVVEALSETPDVIMTIELNNVDVYFYGDNYAYTVNNALNPIDRLRRFEIIMFQAQGGSPIKDYNTRIREFDVRVNQSFYEYTSYGLHANGPVLTWCELDNGLILMGGRFTRVTYTINNIPKTIYCNHIAILQTDGRIIPLRDFDKRFTPQKYNKTNGVSGPGAVVRSIIQTNDGSIMIGGRFNRVVGRGTDCLNIVHINVIDEVGRARGEFRDVEGGLRAEGQIQGVFTLAHDRRQNFVYVGGSFTSAVNTSNSSGSQLRNAAIYSINQQYKWRQLHFGANGVVKTMTLRGTELFIGGTFTAMRGNSGNDLLTQTRHACLFDTRPSTSEANRVKSLSQIAVQTISSTIPARNSVFNNEVKKILVDSYGQVIIGGLFTEIDYNDNQLPSPDLQTLSVGRIVRWDGFGRFTPMDTGLANNTLGVGYGLRVNDICSSPYNDDVYVVGQFGKVGSIGSAICIARWTKNRWEALDFEMQVQDAQSVFISKRGYGFVSVSTITNANKNRLYEPFPIVIENVGMQTQCVLELTNPKSNFNECELISIYNVTTNKSMTFNMKIAIGETVRIDLTRSNVQPKSNVRNVVLNSLVGGGTFANFFLTEGVNILKILGGQRFGASFTRPLQVAIRYHAKQISPYQIFETERIRNREVGVAFELGRSKLGLDTKVFNDIKDAFPLYDWASYVTWTLDRNQLGVDAVINE
jgi:hypothetical protein